MCLRQTLITKGIPLTKSPIDVKSNFWHLDESPNLDCRNLIRDPQGEKLTTQGGRFAPTNFPQEGRKRHHFGISGQKSMF